MEKIKVSLIDDHGIVRFGTETLLKSYENLELICSTGNVDEFKSSLKLNRPHVVLIDLVLSQGIEEGLELIDFILSNYNEINIIVITGITDLNTFNKCIKKGVKGYILKKSDISKHPTLNEIIENVASGDRFLDSSLSFETMPYVNNLPKDKTFDDFSNQKHLTQRMLEVIELIVQDYQDKEIAKKLVISEATVKTHLQHIYQKLSVKNRTELKNYALVHNLFRNESNINN